MKKIFFGLAALIPAGRAVTAPGTAGEANGGAPAPAGGGMDIDAAIREAAARTEGKIPGGIKTALVSAASTSARLSEYGNSRPEAALAGGGKLVVADRANPDKVRAEQRFRMPGGADDDSAKSRGRLLGAGAIVTGGPSGPGDVFSLTLKAINTESATAAVLCPADIAKTTEKLECG